VTLHGFDDQKFAAPAIRAVAKTIFERVFSQFKRRLPCNAATAVAYGTGC
jgi:hypothetical protein